MKWQVKDFADGWIDVADEAAARKLSREQSGAAIRPVMGNASAMSVGTKRSEVNPEQPQEPV